MRRFQSIKGRIALFAGTSEGRELAEIYVQSPPGDNEMDVYVTTQYGADCLPQDPRMHIHVGCFLRESMLSSFTKNKPALVIDSTHPYAFHITETLTEVCGKLGLSYLRVQRPLLSGKMSSLPTEGLRLFLDFTALVKFLQEHEGNVLITSGAGSLAQFASLPDFAARCWLRALPTAAVLAQAEKLGLPGRHLFLMQGPFSAEMNLAMLRHCDATYLVTKLSGQRGGFPEKQAAAAEAGVTLLAVGRPESCPLPPKGAWVQVEDFS